eukprot:s381_g19.t1
MAYWQFARFRAADRAMIVQLSLENDLFQSVKTPWNAASRATSIAMNKAVENEMPLHTILTIRDNGYQCAQYILKEKFLMPGPPACDVLVFQHKYIPEILVFAPTRSLNTEVQILKFNPNVDDEARVLFTVVPFGADFELMVDTSKAVRFVRDLVLHQLRVAHLRFTQPELGTNVTIKIFHPDGSELPDKCDVTLKGLLHGKRSISNAPAAPACPSVDGDDTDSPPWQLVG